MAKILLVEDDPLLLKMYTKKFEVKGHQVETATNGVDGIAKVKSFKPDLMLMDVMMPKLNGIEALAQIKADPDTRQTPVIILTNLSTTDDAEAALSKGALKYLIKSDYTPAQIVELAEKVLR